MTIRGRASLAGWCTVAALALLACGGAAARPGGMWLGLPDLAAVGLVLAAAGLLAWLVGASGAIAACAGLAFVPLLLVSGVPLSGLHALAGRPLLALVFAAVIVTIAEARASMPRALFFPVVLAVYLGVAARVQGEVGAEGDEPHYLMVAESLIRDHDLSLETDYAEGRYRAFYRTHTTLEPHFRVRGRGGAIYSLHAVGLSLLVLPAYALGGYPAASFFMALLAALLALAIRELVRASSASDGVADGVGWVVALSPPLVHYAGLVFTEVPAALAVALVLRPGRELAQATQVRALALGAVIAFLPWLNVRYAPLAVILLLSLLTTRPRRPVVLGLLLPSLLSALALAAYHFVLYGFFDPRRVYGVRRELSLALLPEGLQGMLLDQEFGLLVYAPVFALAVPGLFALFRESRRAALTTVALLGVVLVTAGSWPMWRGGFNPPARFLLPVVPALALALAARLRAGWGAGAALLAGWSLFTGLAGGAEPRLIHRDRDGTAPFFRSVSGAEEWTRLLPGYVLADSEPDRHRLAAVWVLALALAASRWRRPASPGAGLALGAAGLIVAASIASSLSDARTGGRDAVRVVGRPALAVPGWRWAEAADAQWGPERLGWGPLYEPHRHPDGADLGSRLLLAPGRYRLFLEGEEPPSALPPPDLEVRPEGVAGPARLVPLERVGGGSLAAHFDVAPGERAVTLALRSGAPFLLKGVRLERSTVLAPGGLKR